MKPILSDKPGHLSTTTFCSSDEGRFVRQGLAHPARPTASSSVRNRRIPAVTHSSSARSPRAIVGALLLAATLAACGAPNDSASPQTTPSPGTSGFPVDVVSGAAGSTDTITIDQRPEAIVSLSPTATESLFAIDAGDQVVAVDDQSNYPAEAPVTQLSGYTPNVEAILSYSPDLVITAMPDPDTVASLAAAGVPTLALPPASTLDEAYDQLARLGQATGNTDQAAALVADMKSRIEQAVSAAPDLSGVSYFHELDPTLYTVSSSSFIGEIYGLFGMKSIADAAPGGDAFPQLSEEFVVDANPDVDPARGRPMLWGPLPDRSPSVPAGPRCAPSSRTRSSS